MATKDSMRDDIRLLEPDNPLAARDSATHEELKTELKAAKRRKEARDKQSAIPSILRYRLEDGDSMSWKLYRRDTGDELTQLSFGQELPVVGSLVTVDADTQGRVVSHENGLSISAGDLVVRETFDARRIYTTPNGTNIVFKRMEGGRAVLWSYRTQSEIMIGGQVEMTITDRRAKPTATTQKRMTQKLLASWLISEDPRITSGDLTAALQEAFPQMSIGARHGPHYLSLSRNGRLPEPPDDDPRTW